MRVLLVAALLLAGQLVVCSPVAAAGPCELSSTGSSTQSNLNVGVTEGCDGSTDNDPDLSNGPHYVVETCGVTTTDVPCPPCPGTDVLMVTYLVHKNGERDFHSSECGDPQPSGPTTRDVANAFARLSLPGSQLVIQPPDGLTLVNFDTNFYTDDTEAITRSVTLLGQRVTIEATPSRYVWHFGDDTKMTTTDPGAAYPDLRVTHNYLRKDTYRPSLDTTYSGRYRVGNGSWQDIPGTVTINGPAQSLRAIEASPKLVGY